MDADEFKELENQIKQLSNELNKFKEVLENKMDKIRKEKSNKRKKPEYDQIYFYLDCENEVSYEYWKNTSIDNNIFNNYITFLTEEEAEKAQRVKETENLLRRYVEEYDTKELDWNNSKTKWSLSYDYYNKKICYDYTYNIKSPRTVYASSKKVLEDVVKEIGNDRIVEYIIY